MPVNRVRTLLLVLGVVALTAGVTGCRKGDSIARSERAAITLVPTSVIFDAITLGDRQERQVLVQNSGGADLMIDDWSWRGNAAEFSVTGLDGVVVEPGGTATFSIEYAPVDAERDAATLIIRSNASNDPEAEIDVASAGQSGTLATNPTAIDLSVDRLDEPATAALTLYNIGSRPFDVSALRMEIGMHFGLADLPESMPATIAPDDELTLTVVYAPRNGGSHDDRLIIDCDADNCFDGRYFVDLVGTAFTPLLRVVPGDVSFGAVPLDERVTETATAINEGEAVLTIDSISFAPNPADGDTEILLETVGGEPWTPEGQWQLEPSESTSLVLSYTPVDTAPDLEFLVFRSNDPELPIQQIRVGGQAAAPRVEVFPNPVEFPLTAATMSSTRDLTIRNGGTEALQLEPLVLQARRGAFSMTNADTMPAELAPGESFNLQLVFAPPTDDVDPGVDEFFASLFVLPTNDPETAEVIVQLQGVRAPMPFCEIRTIPATINFGVVPRGTRREQSATLRNVGPGPCDVSSARLEPPGLLGLFSNYFEFVGTDPRTPVDLDPGDEMVVTAAYFPRSLTPLSEVFGDSGSIEVNVTDPNAVGDDDVECGIGGGGLPGSSRLCGVNLQARSAIAQIAVIPGAVDVGLVTLGCNSQTQTLRVYNTGSADVEVTGMRLEECSPEFRLTGVPALPRMLAPGASFEVSVTYRPTTPGSDRCQLVVEGTTEGGGVIVVPLAGEGVTFSRTVDRFEQVSGRAVDVLFVVDNSGSMGEEQSNLGRNFDSFIRAARTWDSDFQIGIVTTQIDGTVSHPSSGGREPGELVGDPRIITPRTPSFESEFASNVRVGTGDPGTAESGLEAARMALTDPNITDLDVPCGADCVEPYMCTPDASGRDRLCGGYNRTFLREEASLEIVFVSDEEDQSRASVEFFVDFFRSIKGALNTSLFHASTIVGPRGGCTSGDGEADAGDRYMDIAEATGGEVASICDS